MVESKVVVTMVGYPGCAVIVRFFLNVSFAGASDILFAPSFDGAFIVRVEANTLTSLASGPFAELRVAARTYGGGFRKEEGEKFVWDGKMRSLLELLQRGEPDEHFQKGQRRADGRERRSSSGCVRGCGAWLLG